MTELQPKIDSLFRERRYFEIIRLLEETEPDYARALSLARAYLNASLKSNDPLSLSRKAQEVLDRFAVEGRDDPYWLYYKGFALYQENLIPDSLTRFERALRFVNAGDELFGRIRSLRDSCRGLMIQSEFKGVSGTDRELLVAHIEQHFGPSTRLAELFSVEIRHVAPTAEHPYNLLVSAGLAAKRLPVPQGYDQKQNGRLELCLALPADYRFKRDRDADWPVFLLLDLVRHVIGALDFIGFGYYIKESPSLSPATVYDGVMLTAMGDYPGEAQSLSLSDGSTVCFYQLIPLRPMETRYREHHGALELLKLFEKERLRLTPFIEGRPDVCAGPESLRV